MCLQAAPAAEIWGGLLARSLCQGTWHRQGPEHKSGVEVVGAVSVGTGRQVLLIILMGDPDWLMRKTVRQRLTPSSLQKGSRVCHSGLSLMGWPPWHPVPPEPLIPRLQGRLSSVPLDACMRLPWHCSLKMQIPGLTPDPGIISRVCLECSGHFPPTWVEASLTTAPVFPPALPGFTFLVSLTPSMVLCSTTHSLE